MLTAHYAPLVSSLAQPRLESPRLGGIGGVTDAYSVNTILLFHRDDGRKIAVTGNIAVFTEPAVSDISILGCDVTDNFSVIYSRPEDEVVLLAPPHRYAVSPSG